MGTLAESARALMAATADVAGEQVSEARKRLAAALEGGKEIYGRARDKALREPRPPIRPCTIIPIKPSASRLVWDCSSAFSSLHGAPATGTDPTLKGARLAGSTRFAFRARSR